MNSGQQNHVGLSIRILACIAIAGITMYAYILKQNELTGLRLMIPTVAKELKAVQEENIRLKYEIDRFESPIHLMELARKPEFSHLKYPYAKDVIKVKSQPGILAAETIDIDETKECQICPVR